MFPRREGWFLPRRSPRLPATAIAQQKPAAKGGKHHQLPATLQDRAVGLARSEGAPEVSPSTRRHHLDRDHDAWPRQGAAGTTIEQVVELRKANPAADRIR